MTGNWPGGNYSQFYLVTWVMNAKLIWFCLLNLSYERQTQMILFVKRKSPSFLKYILPSQKLYLHFIADVSIFNLQYQQQRPE